MSASSFKAQPCNLAERPYCTRSSKISRRAKNRAGQLLKTPWGPSGWPRGLTERPYFTDSSKISRREENRSPRLKSSPQLLKTSPGLSGWSRGGGSQRGHIALQMQRFHATRGETQTVESLQCCIRMTSYF